MWGLKRQFNVKMVIQSKVSNVGAKRHSTLGIGHDCKTPGPHAVLDQSAAHREVGL